MYSGYTMTERTYYHGSIDQITEFHAVGTCLTDDPEIATSYLNGNHGYLYEVTVQAGRVATEQDLRDAADELGLTDTYHYAFELADNRDVRAKLIEWGYTAVEYRDLSPNNEREHETLLTLGAQITIIRVEEIEAEEAW